MKLEAFICDRCGLQTQGGGIVTFVEVTFGGNGAARDKIDGIDLCNGCYGKMAGAIRESTSPVPRPHHSGETP